jgi:CRISPR-associated endonuclease/helicase Cas3
MDIESPASVYAIGGAGIPVEVAQDGFPFPQARGFQATALDWIRTDDAPVGCLSAPTGSGKTAVIASLARDSSRILCLYPTNALVAAQAATFESEFGLDVEIVTGDTLTGTGDVRSQNLMQYGTDPSLGDVVITNPDILQAVLHGLYFSPGSKILEFFSHFEAAVYDEFHYYDPLAASGLLMQIKVLSERGAYRTRDGSRVFPKILLSSATPDDQFISHVRDDLGLSVEEITSELAQLDIVEETVGGTELVYDISSVTAAKTQPPDVSSREPPKLSAVPTGVERFRYPMCVRRRAGYIGNQFEELAALLSARDHHTQNGKAAVIFNSAARSNEFYRYLTNSHPDLAADTRKDNGYDTGDSEVVPGDFCILNTTSKGEVGLDFNLDHLIMATPHTATGFIQRIGRAARHSPAVVDLYGLDDPLWPQEQSYPNFLQRVIQTLPTPATTRDRLRNLVGLRAARALHTRYEDDMYHSPDIDADFRNFDTRAKWQSFMAAVDTAEALRTNGVDDPFAPSLGRPAATTITIVAAGLDGLDSLRGRSVTHPITYPRGDRQARTEYDLIRALRHHTIQDVTEELIILGVKPPKRLRGTYPANLGNKQFDLLASDYELEEQLQRAYQNQVQTADLSETDLSKEILQHFGQVVNFTRLLHPHKIETNDYVIKCSDGSVSDIESV